MSEDLRSKGLGNEVKGAAKEAEGKVRDAAADITGIMLASVVAALGFLVIPARRRKAKTEMRQKLSDLRGRLGQTLRQEFERAQERGRARIDDAVAPYTRFVRAEQERWTGARATLTQLREKTGSFRDQIAA